MKKVFVLIGSRHKGGNTTDFVNNIVEKLDKKQFSVEYAYPQDYKITPCLGCQKCFSQTKCVCNDDLVTLQEKILEADLFIIASPVYLHYFTGDLKIILDKCSWWAHTFRLQGKPVVVLSTCDTNGHKTVTRPLSHIMTYMGGNVIACANASVIPNQLFNDEWKEEVSKEIVSRIVKYTESPHQSNKELDRLFPILKQVAIHQKETVDTYKLDLELGEYDYWHDSGMLEYESFDEYLNEKYGRKEVAV